MWGSPPHPHRTLESNDLALEWAFVLLQALETLQTVASPTPHGSRAQDLYIIFQPVVGASIQASCKCPTHLLEGSLWVLR